jgi:hypothetical protein
MVIVPRPATAGRPAAAAPGRPSRRSPCSRGACGEAPGRCRSARRPCAAIAGQGVAQAVNAHALDACSPARVAHDRSLTARLDRSCRGVAGSGSAQARIPAEASVGGRNPGTLAADEFHEPGQRCSALPDLPLLCQEIDGVWLSCSGGGRLEQAPDAAGEVALEAADRFAGALAFAASSGDVVAGLRVTACAGDDHAVQGRVDLAVAALIEPLALRS